MFLNLFVASDAATAAGIYEATAAVMPANAIPAVLVTFLKASPSVEVIFLCQASVFGVGSLYSVALSSFLRVFDSPFKDGII